jgi:acyl-ACP thioesterase
MTDAVAAMVPMPERGRLYTASRKVRLGDTTAGGRLRLDALSRYLQDVANDDAMDAGLEAALAWVVRRVVVELTDAPKLGDVVDLVTFCGGTGGRWAERRTRVSVGGEVAAEAQALWVHLDPATGRPAPLGEDFLAIYGEAAGGRTVRPKLIHRPPPDGADRRAWPQRAVDVDVLGHVNNAVALEAVEQVLDGRSPSAVAVEYRDPIDPGDRVELVTSGGDLWLTVGADVRVSARFRVA